MNNFVAYNTACTMSCVFTKREHNIVDSFKTHFKTLLLSFCTACSPELFRLGFAAVVKKGDGS